jgi:hypothetical protein
MFRVLGETTESVYNQYIDSNNAAINETKLKELKCVNFLLHLLSVQKLLLL